MNGQESWTSKNIRTGMQQSFGTKSGKRSGSRFKNEINKCCCFSINEHRYFEQTNLIISQLKFDHDFKDIIFAAQLVKDARDIRNIAFKKTKQDLVQNI